MRDGSDKMKLLTLDEIQREELAILHDLTQFLDERNLRYSLHAGTLLGAVRHSGFIPWDDDVDIAMPRPDYERFLKIAGALPDDLFVLTNRNSVFPMMFAKVCTRKVRAQQAAYDGIMNQYLWVDVFPIDGLPDDLRKARRHFRNARLNRRLAIYTTLDTNAVSGSFRRLLVWLYRVLPAKNWRRSYLNRRFDRLVARYSFESSSNVTVALASGASKLWMMPKRRCTSLDTIVFEGNRFSCYSEAEDLLVESYGDYRKLPPPEERKSHEIRCWRVD